MIRLLPLAFAPLLLAACGQSNSATITLTEFQIKPKGVALKADRPTTLTIVNNGKVEHNLEVDPAATDSPKLAVLQPGERTTVTFTPKSAGTFTYQCTIPGHAPAGMTGALTVR